MRFPSYVVVQTNNNNRELVRAGGGGRSYDEFLSDFLLLSTEQFNVKSKFIDTFSVVGGMIVLY